MSNAYLKFQKVKARHFDEDVISEKSLKGKNIIHYIEKKNNQEVIQKTLLQ